MTFKNAKRLYEHFVSKGMTNCAADIAKKYPELAAKPKAEPKPKPKK